MPSLADGGLRPPSPMSASPLQASENSDVIGDVRVTSGPSTDTLASFFAARTAHLTDPIFADGAAATPRRRAARLSYGTHETPRIRAAMMPSPAGAAVARGRPDADAGAESIADEVDDDDDDGHEIGHIGPGTGNFHFRSARSNQILGALYGNVTRLTETIADVLYDVNIHGFRERALEPWSEGEEQESRLGPPVSRLDLELGARAVRAAVPYAVCLELPAGAAGIATMRCLRQESNNMFVLVVDENVKVSDFAGGDEDALLIFWATPTAAGESATAIIDVDVDGSTLTICLNMHGVMPAFQVIPEADMIPPVEGFKITSKAQSLGETQLIFSPGQLQDEERVITIVNETPEEAPLLVEITLGDSSDGAFGIATRSNDENQGFMLVKLHGADEHTFFVHCRPSQSTASGSGIGASSALLGHLLISLPTFVPKKGSRQVDSDLLHHFDKVVDLVRPIQEEARSDSLIPVRREVGDAGTDVGPSAGDENDDYADDDNDKCREMYFIETSPPPNLDVRSEFKAFNLSSSLNSSLLRGMGTLDSLLGALPSPEFIRKSPSPEVAVQSGQVSMGKALQPRLGFEKTAIAQRGIVLQADESEKEFLIQNRSATPVRILVAVSGKARYNLDVTPVGGYQSPLSPRGRMQLNVRRRSPSGCKCSVSIWAVEGDNIDFEVIRKGALPEGVSRYKIQVRLEAQKSGPRVDTVFAT